MNTGILILGAGGIPGLAEEYGFRKQEVFVEHHPVITRARRGDLIRVIRYVKDTHGLSVKDFKMTLLHRSHVSEKGGHLGANEVKFLDIP